MADVGMKYCISNDESINPSFHINNSVSPFCTHYLDEASFNCRYKCLHSPHLHSIEVYISEISLVLLPCHIWQFYVVPMACIILNIIIISDIPNPLTTCITDKWSIYIRYIQKCGMDIIKALNSHLIEVKTGLKTFVLLGFFLASW